MEQVVETHHRHPLWQHYSRATISPTLSSRAAAAHSVGEAPGTIFELALDRFLAALDGESTVSPSGGYGFPARAASYHQGLDFQLGRVNEKGRVQLKTAMAGRAHPDRLGSTSGNISTRTCRAARRPGARSRPATR